MVAFSYFGAYAWLTLAIVMGLARPRRWPGVFQVILAIGLSTLLTDTIVKPLVGRSRPYVLYTDIEVIGSQTDKRIIPIDACLERVRRRVRDERAFPAARAIFWTLALLVAFARVYVGVHYPSDVLFGGLIGLAAAAFVVGGTRWSYGESESKK